MFDWQRLSLIGGTTVAAITVWGWLGFPVVATSADVQRLDREQATIAVELYNQKVRSLLTIPPPEDFQQRTFWEQELERAKRMRDAAEDRALGLR